MLGFLINDPAVILRISIFKGILFIILTSFILYHLIAGYVQESRLAAEALQRVNEELETRVVERTKELDKNRQELERQNKELRATYRKLRRKPRNGCGQLMNSVKRSR